MLQWLFVTCSGWSTVPLIFCLVSLSLSFSGRNYDTRVGNQKCTVEMLLEELYGKVSELNCTI